MSQKERVNHKIQLLHSASTYGRSFKKMAFNTSQVNDRDVHTYCYSGGEGIEFYLWMDKNNNIIRQQMNFLGHVSEWNIVDGVKTGYVLEAHETVVKNDDKEHKINEIIFDELAVDQTLSFCLDVVANMMILKPEIQKTVIYNYKNSPMISNLSAEYIKEKFFHFEETQKVKRFNFKSIGEFIFKIFAKKKK